MIATLTELVAPLPADEFLTRLRERRLQIVRGQPGRFDDLLTWDTVRDLIEQEKVPVNKLRVTRAGVMLPRPFFTKDGHIVGGNVLRVLAEGGSLLLNGLDAHIPALALLTANIRAELGERVGAVAVVTTGGGGALKQHFDPPDVIVLQLEGSKRWLVYDRPVIDPVHDMEDGPPPESVVFDTVVQAGDLLFVPAGHWHRCENSSERSTHVAITLVPPTPVGILRELAAELRKDPAFRRPLARCDRAGQAAARDGMRKMLLDEINRRSAADLCALAAASRGKDADYS